MTKRRHQLHMNINIGGEVIKQVESFRYLGSLIDESGKCNADIKSRIAMGKAQFGQLRRILTCLNLNKGLRMRILKTYIWPVILYGCESWTMNKEIRKILEAAEMWFVRRMMRVPWVARRTNEEVLRMAGVDRELLSTVYSRQLGFLGHILRGDGLERDCLLGMIDGTRARGRQRTKFLDGIKSVVGCRKVQDVVRMEENRGEWRSIVANVNIDTAPR